MICGRCQATHYCNADCQKLDWKRHKRYCKRLPVAVAAPASNRELKAGRMSTSKVEDELLRALQLFVYSIDSRPESLPLELPRILKVVASLVARGARTDAQLRHAHGYSSCLSFLCARGHKGMEPLLEVLLAADVTPPVDPAAADRPDSGHLVAPISYVIRNFRPSFLRVVIAHDADILQRPCLQGSEGELVRPVHVCVHTIRDNITDGKAVDGALETLDCLISAGAVVDAVDDQWVGERASDATALLCTLMWNADFVRQRLHSPDRTVLDAVAMKLIEVGADVNAPNHLKARPLDYAACLPSLDVFKALIAKGADAAPTTTDVAFVSTSDGEQRNRGVHYLQFAIQDGRADVLQAAAEAGVNLKKVKSLGNFASPLLAYSVVQGQLACVKFLLEYGCDVNEGVQAGGRGAHSFRRRRQASV